MLQPVKSGQALIDEIDQTGVAAPTLWWLGHAGFVIRFASITFYIDACLSTPPGTRRRIAAPLAADQIRQADMIFATHAHAGHMDGPSLVAMLEASRHAKLVLPRSTAEHALSAGVPYNRMTTTDAGLRIEYFKDRLYGRVYAAPSAHPRLDYTQDGGYPYLGYIIRFGRSTIYHAGDGVPYDGLAERLRPYNVTVALMPVGGRNFSVSAAAQLAEDIGAAWVVPMHYGTFLNNDPALNNSAGDSGIDSPDDTENEFITHMLGHRPDQRFKIFQAGEKWTVPDEI